LQKQAASETTVHRAGSLAAHDHKHNINPQLLRTKEQKADEMTKT